MSEKKIFYYDRPVSPQDFVGRWNLVTEIVSDLRCPQPSSWAVIGGRRFGKTSVLKTIESQLLTSVAHSTPGELRVFPLLVDLKGCGKGTERAVYAGILRGLYQSLQGISWIPFKWEETELYNFKKSRREEASVYDFQDILEDLERNFEEADIPLRLVLLLDEAESATDFSWSGIFFDQLRALIHTGSLADFVKIVLTGAAKVTGMKQKGSLLLNAVKIEHLAALSGADIQELVSRAKDVPPEVASAIQLQCGGHPFIAQYLLHHLSKEGLAQSNVHKVRRVAHQMRHRVKDFQIWWEALGDSGQQAYATLAAEQDWMDEPTLQMTIHEAKQPLDHGMAALCYHGLAIQDNELRYHITGQLFQDWFMFNVSQQISNLSNKTELHKEELPVVVRVLIERIEQHIGAQTNVNGTINGNVIAGLVQSVMADSGNVRDNHKENHPSQVKALTTHFQNGYALIIGVGADLPNTVDDAQGLSDMLKDEGRCAYPPEHVTLLTGSHATRAAILTALDTLAHSVASDPSSTVLIYFSGHGYHVSASVGDAYFMLPYGYDVQRLKQTAISGAEFTAKLHAITTEKLLILLDCCHAGGIGDAKTPGLEFAKSPLPPEALALLVEGKGQVLIASSKENELSYAGKPYSAFTLALMESLAGLGIAKQDGYVRVADVALHAREVVPERTKGKQHPVLHFEHADNFVLAYYAGGDTQSKGLPFDTQSEIVLNEKPLPQTTVFDQHGQTVYGPQTNIGGDVHGPLLSGQFTGSVTVNNKITQ